MKSQIKSKKMGRPQSAEKRQAILKAAGEVFMEVGFAASVDRIAELAGVSKQTVYGHFGNKEDLYRAAGIHTMRAPVASMIDRSLPLAEALRRYGLDTLTRLLSDALVTTHRRLIEQAATFPAMAKVHAEFGPGLSIQVLADYFAEQIAAGVLRTADVRLAAEDFLSLLQGMSRLDRLFGHTAEPEAATIGRHVDHTIEIFMRAYGGEPRSASSNAADKAATQGARKRAARPRGQDDR
jgi:TetR/AcrR family transcriptional repressor of mexJK operon